MAEKINIQELRNLIPINSLKGDHLQELAQKTMVEEIPGGTVIFRKGDKDKKTVYVLKGEVHMTDGRVVRVIKGGTTQSFKPLTSGRPYTFTATAKTDCRITRVDAELLDIFMTWDQMSGIQVKEIASDPDALDVTSDWMTRILKAKAFMQIPPANIHALFVKTKEVPVCKGDVIIKQGDEGKYYYIIKQGKCEVSRATKTGSVVVLAELSDGDAFGEEALLSEQKCNANVTMISDGVLMRLAKDDFNQLLKQPMLNWITAAEADELAGNGEGVFIDVRLDSEYKQGAIPGSQNIPLFMLRMKAEGLDRKKKYILYCDSGRRSSAAAFLLKRQGLQTYCLKDGFEGYKATS